MKRQTSTRFGIVLFTLMAVTLSAQSLRKDGRYWRGEIEKTFKVGKTGVLVIDDVRGDVIIRTWDKKEVYIHEIKRMDIFSEEEAKHAMEESQRGYIQRDDVIEIGGEGFQRRWIQSRFEITVPLDFDCDISTDGGDLDIVGTAGEIEASTGGGDIDMNDIGGEVNARTGGGDITISRTQSRVKARTGGGDIEIRDIEKEIDVSTGGGDVSVSHIKDRAKVSTGGGDVSLSNTQGDVTISTGGGEIEIEDASGHVNLSTGGGGIYIRNVQGNFNVSTGGGEIEAKTIHGYLQMRTGGGDIDLSDIKGAVDVATGGGDVSLEISLTDFSVDHAITIITGGGDIDLSLPAKIPATIDAEIKYRKRSWEDYEISSEFPLKITKEDENHRYRIIQARGDINGGGDRILLKTGGGNININKK